MANSEVNQIISEGNVGFLVDTAAKVGSNLARQLTTSQIRNIFGEVRRIEALWPAYKKNQSEVEQKNARQAYRSAILLRPKLAYQAKRERGRGIEELQDVLDPCLEILQKELDDEKRKLYFDRFVDFFEAILAYHKAAGGN